MAEFDAPDQKVLVARCARCGGFVAELWAHGWDGDLRGWSADGRSCPCPTTSAPHPDALSAEVSRARRTRRPVTVRLG